MDIKSEKIEIVSIDSLIPHPKNNNIHPPEQIERLQKIIEYQGFRVPPIIQAGTNLVVAGHGRIEAAKNLGMTKIPVIYQEFESAAQLYAFMTADNAIASWAKLDLDLIKVESLDLGDDFDFDFLAIKSFPTEDAEMIDNSDLDYSDKNKEIDTANFGNDLQHMCPKCGFEFNE